jgi:hypothetical protein
MEQTNPLKDILTGIILDNTAPAAWDWLSKFSAGKQTPKALQTAFVSMPRKTSHATIHYTTAQADAIHMQRPGFTIANWSVDRLCRVWLLLHADAADKEEYFRFIENLFLAAEMNELVALYSSLPVLSYPETWRNRCAEGIRSNIGTVLEAIICDNPYPSEQLSDAAWNQLVMKAFFTEKPVHRIIGLDSRANRELAYMLCDYANERWAASRTVNPQLWRCVGKFIDDRIFPGIERAFHSVDPVEKQAAALACYASNYLPAQQLLEHDPQLRTAIEKGTLNWDKLAKNLVILSEK